MTDKDYKQAKRTICTIFIMMSVILLLLLCAFIKKENPELSAEHLRSRLETAQELCIRVEEMTYLLPGGASTASLFNDLEKTKARPDGQAPHITIHFGELYEFYIYENGIIEGFDGYAKSGTKSSAFYQTDNGLYESLKSIILTNGRPYDENIGFFR